MKPPPDPSKHHISFHAIVIFILSAIQAISGFGLMVIHGYKSAVQTIKHVNESSNHTPDEVDRPPTHTSVAPDASLLTTAISKRLPDASSVSSVSSKQRDDSPERCPPADTQIPHLLRYADPPLAMVTTVLSLNKRYAALAITNTLDIVTSLFMPFLDKFVLRLFIVWSIPDEHGVRIGFYHTFCTGTFYLRAASWIWSERRRGRFSLMATYPLRQ